MQRNYIFLFILAVGLFASCHSPKIESVEVLKWKGGATAAYTIIHDDLCFSDCSGIHRYADTIAHNRGIKISAGAVVGSCMQKGEPMWEILRRMVSHGHEILSHSWEHGASVDLVWTPENWDLHRDVITTKRLIEENVPGTEVTFMIFPYDAYNDQRLDELKQNGYLGSRSGKRQYEDRGVVTDFSSYDPFRSNRFDAFMSKAEQEQLSLNGSSPVSIYDNSNDNVEIQHLEAAIAAKGWSIQELHSVDDEEPWGWGHISVNRYRALIDYAKAKADAGHLWVETPSTVVRYIMSRENLPAPQIMNENVLTFQIPDDFDLRYASELSYQFKIKGKASQLTGQQSGKLIVAKSLGNNTFVLDVNPALGNVELTW